MLGWIPFAFIRIVVFFSAGILLAVFRPDLPFRATNAYLIFFTCCTLYLILAFTRRSLNINPGIAGLATIFFAGYCNVQLHTDSRRLDHLNHLNLPVEYYTAIITLPPEEKDHSWKMRASIDEVRTMFGWEGRTGELLLYLPKTDFKATVQVWRQSRDKRSASTHQASGKSWRI